MTIRPIWRDAEARAARLNGSEQRLLLFLVRLPLTPVEVLAQLIGARGPSSAYETVMRLRGAGLVGLLQPPFQAGHAARLLYLTDLGVATVAVDQGVDARDLATRARLRGEDLLAVLPGIAHIVGAYQMLGALAAAYPQRARLVGWERPWRRRFERPTARALGQVEVPAYAALAWDEGWREALLIPDLGLVPLRVYRRLVERLTLLRRAPGRHLPPLLVATPHEGRSAGWRWLLDDVSATRREAAVPAVLTTWAELRRGDGGLDALPWQPGAPPETLGRRLSVRRLSSTCPDRVIPALVDSALDGSSTRATNHPGHVALGLTPADRQMLDVVGHHPFLTASDLAMIMGWTVPWANRRCRRLVRLGLLRSLSVEEVGPEAAAETLLELTAAGGGLVASHLGLSLKAAIRETGLVGGGADEPVGARASLVRHLSHTLGVNGVFVHLYRLAQRFRTEGRQDVVLHWRNAAACGTRLIHPDGYGIYQHDGVPFGFFLEYDRGTMNRRGYRAKFVGYCLYQERRLFRREYTGMPTILVLTQDEAAEARILSAARSASVGRALELPLLVTSEWRVFRDPRNSDGLLGHIWRARADKECVYPYQSLIHTPSPEIIGRMQTV